MCKNVVVRDEYVATIYGSLHLVTAGNEEGQPILFLHGITECAKAFIPVMELLPQDYFLVATDLRGRGESFKPEKGYKMDDYIEDLVAILNRFVSLKYKPIIVAHSMSARFTTKFAAQFPSLIDKLILIDPPISGPGRRPFPVAISRFLDAKKAIDRDDEARFEQFYDPKKIDLTLKKYEMKNCTVEAIEQSYHSIATESFHIHFTQLTVPTMLLAANSPLITEEEFDELSQLNPNVLMRRQRAVGHEMFKENPELFVDEILSFIRGEQDGYESEGKRSDLATGNEKA